MSRKKTRGPAGRSPQPSQRSGRRESGRRESETQRAPSTPELPAPKPITRPFDAHARPVLLMSAVLLAALGLSPWLPGLWPPGFWQETPGLVVALFPWLLLSGLAVASLGALRSRVSDEALAITASGLALPALYHIFLARPDFAPSLFAGGWEQIVAIPVALGAVVAAAGLHAQRLQPDTVTGRVVAGAGAVVLLSAALVPHYAVSDWAFPLFEYVRSLGAGTLGAAAGGAAALLLVLSAALVLATLPSRPSGALARWRGRLQRGAFWTLLVTPAAWLALAAVDGTRSGSGDEVTALPRLLMGLTVLILSLWGVMGLRRLAPILDRSPAPPERWLRRGPALGLNAAWWLAVATVFVLFFLLKTHGLRASATDENIYFYGAELMRRGHMPYRDFFFAHPPLHLVVPAGIFALIGGFELTVAKLIPVVATLITGALVFAIGRRHMGRIAGFAAVVAFLFANEVLKASTNMTGINLTVMWMTGGLWAALRHRWLTSGVLLALAICTGFYSIAAALALVVLAAFAGRRALLRIAIAFAGLGLAINGLFYAIGGESYIDGVYLYHAKKPSRKLAGQILKTVYYHPLTFWLAALAPVAAFVRHALGWAPVAADEPRGETPSGAGAALRALVDPRTLWRGRPEDAARVASLVTAALVIEFTMFKELNSFYFVLWFPTLSLLAGYAIGFLVEALLRAFRATALPGGARRSAWVALGAVVAVSMWIPVCAWADSSLRERGNRGFVQEYEKRGAVKHFPWTDPPLLPSLAGVVKTLFWHGERVQGDLQPGYAWYLQSKKRYFETAQEIAKYIAENTDEDETITGASTVAPLIALLSGRDMSALEIDTNSKRFKSGILTRQKFFEEVCHDRVRYVIAARRSFFWSRSPRVPTTHPTVNTQFSVDRVFRDAHLRYWYPTTIRLLRRTTPNAAEGEPVCRFVPPRSRAAPKGQRTR